MTKFELSLTKLIKSHYKKNKRARDSFQVLISTYIDTLSKDPLFDESDSENFPKGAYKPDFEFRKIRFLMPELQGAARKGRFMYVVHQASCSVYPIWVYTHEEYPKRPRDQDLTGANGNYKKKRLKTLEVELWSVAEKLNRPLSKG